jgi:hypothetical protein
MDLWDNTILNSTQLSEVILSPSPPDTHSTAMSLIRKNMPEQTPAGIVANSPSLAALHNRLRILNKESNALFHRAHNTYATDEYTLELLDELDAKSKELMYMIKKVEEEIDSLMKEAEMKGDERPHKTREKKKGDIKVAYDKSEAVEGEK